jgi:alpha-ribazole phosphatase
MRLLLVPHALTDWNVAERFQGWSDTRLNEAGKMQTKRAAERLRRERIDHCYSSSLSRARETAEALGTQRDWPQTTDGRLRELHFGAWEGMTYREIHARDNEALRAWEESPMRIAPPGGETLAELSERLSAFLAFLRTAHPDGATILLVSHRGSLRVVICLLLGLSASAWWQFRLEPASLSEMSLYEKGAVLASINDTHHLRETPHAG